jgi:K+-sensing histidine kinase KdpD
MMMQRPLQTLVRIVATLLIVAGITSFYFFVFKANSTTIAMTFLLATLGVATSWGLLEAIVMAIAGMLCFNFFLMAPLFTFYLADTQNWVALFAFRVKDFGPGIGPKNVHRIFEKYYRIEDSTTRIPGTGMGLAIARDIVKAHGGEIWVESAVGQGSEFFFTLPAAEKLIGQKR